MSCYTSNGVVKLAEESNINDRSTNEIQGTCAPTGSDHHSWGIKHKVMQLPTTSILPLLPRELFSERSAVEDPKSMHR
jgi:hypothetical protein